MQILLYVVRKLERLILSRCQGRDWIEIEKGKIYERRTISRAFYR